MDQDGLLARITGLERTTRRLRSQPGPSRGQVGTKSRLSAKQQVLLVQMTDEHDVATLMLWVGQ